MSHQGLAGNLHTLQVLWEMWGLDFFLFTGRGHAQEPQHYNTQQV